METVIGEGGPNDRMALRLETMAHRHIPNLMRSQLPVQVFESRAKANLNRFERLQLLSAATTYNCYGLAFASRRTCILDDADVDRVLADDGYHTLPWDAVAWREGDLVLYTADSRSISHVAVVTRVDHDLLSGTSEVWVISAWGETGEYLHPVDSVSPYLGKPFRVVSQRFLYDS